MATIKTTDNVHGVMYTIIDAVGNEVSFLNGQTQPSPSPLQPQATGSTTLLVAAVGATFRLTSALATTFGAATATSNPMFDADGKRISFTTPPSIYAGGTYESANASGMRVLFGGAVVDLNATNLTDIDTVVSNFTSAGVLT